LFVRFFPPGWEARLYGGGGGFVPLGKRFDAGRKRFVHARERNGSDAKRCSAEAERFVLPPERCGSGTERFVPLAERSVPGAERDWFLATSPALDRHRATMPASAAS
jgi:hypothetical protein